MQDILINLSGSLISGIFTIIAALVPYYLEKRKPREVVLREIKQGEYFHYSIWYLLLAISLPLLCYFLTGLYALFYGIGTYFMVAEQIPEVVAFDSAKSPVTSWYLGLIEILLFIPLMFTVILFCSKFLAHRSGRNSALYVSLSVIIVWLTDNLLGFIFVAQKELIAVNLVVSFLTYSVAALLGLTWAKKTQERFIVTLIFSKLTPADRAAFCDLAESLLVTVGKES